MSFLTRQSSTDSNYSLCPSISDISMSEEEPTNRRQRQQRQQQRQQQQQQQQQQQTMQQNQQQQTNQQQQQTSQPIPPSATAASAAMAARWRRNTISPPLEYSDTSDDNQNKNHQKKGGRGRSKKQQPLQVPSLPQFKSVSKFRRRSQQSHIIQFGTIPSDMYLSDDDDEEEEEDDGGGEGVAGDDEGGEDVGDEAGEDDDDNDQENRQQHRRHHRGNKKMHARQPGPPIVSLPTTGAATPTPTASAIPKQPPGQEQEEPPPAGYYSNIPSLNQLMSTVAYSFHRATPPALSPSQRKQSPSSKALLSLGLEGLSQSVQASSQSQQQQQQQQQQQSQRTQLPNESSGEVTEYPYYGPVTNPSSSLSFPTWTGTSGAVAAPPTTITNEQSPLLYRHKTASSSSRPNAPPTSVTSGTAPFSIASSKGSSKMGPPSKPTSGSSSSNMPTATAAAGRAAESLSSSKWKKPDRSLYRRNSGRAMGSAAVAVVNRQRNMISQRRFQIAACYLIDYELGRPPTLPPSILTLLAQPSSKQQQQPPTPFYGTTSTPARTIQSMLHWHSWQYSWIWRNLVALAAFTLLVSSSFETTSPLSMKSNTGGDENFHRTVMEHVTQATVLNLVAVAILTMDLWMHRQLRGEGLPSSSTSPVTRTTTTASALSLPDVMSPKTLESSPTKDSHGVGSANVSVGFDPEGSPHQRQRSSKLSQQQPLALPLSIFLVVLALESIQTLIMTFLWTTTDSSTISPELPQRPWFASVFKPLVLFYMSAKARQALEALMRILPIALRVVAMELFVILAFSAVACRLYHTFESFATLPTAWLSLYELSTTVVNPSLWLPLYESSKTSALFFIFFVVISVFYMHSLVLSVVFQIYVQAAADVHERSIIDREYSLRLAFSALQQQPQRSKARTGGPASADNDDDDDELDLEEDLQRSPTAQAVDMASVRQTLRFVRPHYNAMKINALVDIVDPSNKQVIDYPTFRTKIRQALNASVRTPRATTTISLTVELLAVMVAVSNFIYVILLTSSFQADWFDWMTLPGGTLITLLGLLELIVRFNPLRNVTPITRLEGTFDGLALIAALVSIIGVVLFLTGENNPEALEYILMGRALDMMRIMRFLKIFRDVVRRSADVIPALAGPVVLVITALHLLTYTGMALWGGAVQVGQHEGDILPLYDLNNFNSYEEGMVTMFQILVNNDWHAIAQVFLFATRCSSPYIVYPFFVGGQILAGCILLNVVTAFFVESFIAKLSYNGVDGHQERMSIQRDRDDEMGRSFRRMTSLSGRWADALKKVESKEEEEEAVASQESGDHNDVFEFDVYEREGFDHIMRTVTGGQQDDLAHQVCKYLEIFESLAPGRDKVGYLVCCQQTMSRFGNRRFQTMAREYVEDNVLHGVVTDMHTELLVLTSGMRGASFVDSDKSLIRTFPHRTQPAKKMMEVSASLLRNHPAVSLFVSRVIRFKPTASATALAASKR